ncbi:immunity 26/phosphotriesterase HocA family protein [uncultured Roseivirga sp.]|uniref:immunity 26/phosphotriesterase HocA family protein n=1 Tax=uncultured Roseivirga sp. TaxID=543088 RepID=UPI000D79B55D|nr:immunity 26/phosphotriesterase HocA family protein [uncultured Roseivirga sp.]PWL31884.1 MAG: hypothetical protein DCO95_01475 [Roseivirga sp. XM-24bin3]
MFELTNKQREYLGLDPIPLTWDRKVLKGDTYRPESLLYFEGDILKRHISSTDEQYKEVQYHELTKERSVLLPKTSRGKEKKLTGSVLESRTPIGVYIAVNCQGDILIGNHTSQTTFYSSHWDNTRKEESQDRLNINDVIEKFIDGAPEDHISEITTFKRLKRKNIKYKSGDIFSFKISRNEYAFGRILLDIHSLRKKKVIPPKHEFYSLMGSALLVEVYAHISKNKKVNIDELLQMPRLPSDYMMDNVIFYGEYEIIGHKPLKEEDFHFPISYGHTLYGQPIVYLQWGLIHIEKPLKKYNKYLLAENERLPVGHPSRPINNPYSYRSIGFRPRFYREDIKKAMDNNGRFKFNTAVHYSVRFDLRNPSNAEIKNKIFNAFELDSRRDYDYNRKITKTMSTIDLLKLME